MPHTVYERILWKPAENESVKILRIFGESPVVIIPGQIAGCPVTELGSYCFAPDCHLPADGYHTENFKQSFSSFPLPDEDCNYADALTELSGNYIEQISLPDTLYKIGDYSFYNCRHLACIEFGNRLTVIGSDAFMNCHRLEHLHIRCGPLSKSGLRQILAQIPWNVEVSFLEHACMDSDRHAQIQTALFYPEYFEAYNEIAPAHVFGRRITGEGFRARQSFRDGAVDYAQYDTIFQKARAEESEQTVCRLVLCRLRYPTGLSAEKQEQYEFYARMHGKTLCRWLVREKQLDALSLLFHRKLLSQEDAQYAIMLAAGAGWTEGSACMIRWRQSTVKPPAHSKYEFDTF